MKGFFGCILGATLVVWFFIEPESMKTVLLRGGENFVDFVRAIAGILERESMKEEVEIGVILTPSRFL